MSEDQANAILSKDNRPFLCSAHTAEQGLLVDERPIKNRPGVPGSRLVRIRAAGHMTTWEQPAAVNEALAAFLEAQSR